MSRNIPSPIKQNKDISFEDTPRENTTLIAKDYPKFLFPETSSPQKRPPRRSSQPYRSNGKNNYFHDASNEQKKDIQIEINPFHGPKFMSNRSVQKWHDDSSAAIFVNENHKEEEAHPSNRAMINAEENRQQIQNITQNKNLTINVESGKIKIDSKGISSFQFEQTMLKYMRDCSKHNISNMTDSYDKMDPRVERIQQLSKNHLQTLQKSISAKKSHIRVLIGISSLILVLSLLFLLMSLLCLSIWSDLIKDFLIYLIGESLASALFLFLIMKSSKLINESDHVPIIKFIILKCLSLSLFILLAVMIVTEDNISEMASNINNIKSIQYEERQIGLLALSKFLVFVDDLIRILCISLGILFFIMLCYITKKMELFEIQHKNLPIQYMLKMLPIEKKSLSSPYLFS